MPLDEREQRILAEIERQFYEEDPQLARAVRDITRTRPRLGPRMAALGLVAGAALLLLTFTQATWIAAIGFVVMVVSATAMVQAIRHRRLPSERNRSADGASDAWHARLKRKWRFKRS